LTESLNTEITWDILQKLTDTYGDSFYLLDSHRFEQNYDDFLIAFRDLYAKTFIAYSYKTNYIPELCALVDRKGGYAEVVSDMEFDLATTLGVPPQRIIFNGPYKSERTTEKCLLGGGIVNLDSLHEIDIVEKIAGDNPEVNMSLGIRCNFDIGDSATSRFGFDTSGEELRLAFDRLKGVANVRISGLHCHFPNRNIESYIARVDRMLHLSTQLFSSPPELINLGGGFFGPMEESLQKQFDCKVPNYREYAEVTAGKLRRFYQGLAELAKPKLFLEPGTALVADTMKFVVKVVDVKTVRNKAIATVSGSKLNIIPTSNVNLPIKAYRNPEGCCSREYHSIDIAGYTCMENDYLYRGYRGPLGRGDFIVFDNAGSYSIVLKPPFILPNCAIIEYNSQKGSWEIIKREEETQDIFGTFKL
jgi:diaminopimelate decarboxylase